MLKVCDAWVFEPEDSPKFKSGCSGCDGLWGFELSDCMAAVSACSTPGCQAHSKGGAAPVASKVMKDTVAERRLM